VDHAGAVCRGNRFGDLNPDRQRLPQLDGAALKHGAERLAFDVLGRDELRATVVADVVHGQDIGMIEARDRARLALEALHALLVAGRARRQDLQGQPATQANVFG
jgi:hypothetical protein